MYKVILSFRYLLKKRISYLAFLAVALCVFIVVVVMTIMTGLAAPRGKLLANDRGTSVVRLKRDPARLPEGPRHGPDCDLYEN